ncbi:MAG TPA: HAD hydrolase family protein [Polyangiaceae bacterium]|nr:HAD hydrolase family protein [Polyangiaceae bacterium]
MVLAFSEIALLAVDIDGTLTDAKLAWGGPDVGFTQVYSVRDGESIKRLCQRGIPVVPLSRNGTLCARTRMQGLGLPLDWMGVSDKATAFQELCQKYAVSPANMAYVGDGREDVPIFEAVGFPIAVADAHKLARAAAKHVTRAKGGEHALEEVIDLILEANGWM